MTDIKDQTFSRNDLCLRFLFAGKIAQFAGWVDRGEFPGAPEGEGSGRARQYTVQDGLCATLMAQHLNVISTSTAVSAMVADRAVGEIKRSPVFKILSDPDNAPDGEFLLQIARGERWLVRVVDDRADLEFDRGYSSWIINVGELLRDIAGNLETEGSQVVEFE